MFLYAMKILVVDDDPSFNELVSNFLRRGGYTPSSVYGSKSALDALASAKYDLVLVDYKLPGMDGLELIKIIKSTYPGMPVILITNYADIRVAVSSIKLGAFEYVTKPVIPDELLQVIKMALKSEGTEPAKPSKQKPIEDHVVGKNEHTQQLLHELSMVAPTKMNVLIFGESGTGKEHIARTIHKLSRRNTGPFVAVDCGTLSPELAASELFGHVKGAFTGANADKKGLFEEAHIGTLFVDEIGNLPTAVQMALLRAIQEGAIKKVGGTREIQVDIRLVAATNEDLEKNISEGSFRNDLYHRLNEFELHLQPLRKRLDDMEEFCEFFIAQSCEAFGKPKVTLSDEAMTIFRTYSWPGNIRELKNIIRRAVLLAPGTEITAEHLPSGLQDTGLADQQDEASAKTPSLNTTDLSIKSHGKELEKELIINALKKFKYNKSKAANALNIDRSTLYSKIKSYGIDG